MPRRGISRFSIENLSHNTKKLRRGTLLCFTKFVVSKKFMDKTGGCITVFCQNFLSDSAEKFHGGHLLCCFRKFPVAKNFMDKRGEYQDFPSKFFCLTVPNIFVGESFTVAVISGTGKVWIRKGGVSRFSVENFLSHSAEHFRRGILYCCSNFGYRKSLDKKGGSIKIFRRKFFVSVPKTFVGESFTVAVFSGTGEVWIRKGEVSIFSVENFLSHSAENFCRGILYCCSNFGYRKSLDKKGGSINIFRRKFFVSQCRKYSQVNPSVLCFRKFPVVKKFTDKRGEYQDFPSKFFCLTVPKIFVGESFTVAVISGTGKVWIRKGGVSRFSVENFLSQCRKLLKGNPLLLQ